MKRGPTWADAVNCIDKQSSELEVAFLEPEKKNVYTLNSDLKKKKTKTEKKAKKSSEDLCQKWIYGVISPNQLASA